MCSVNEQQDKKDKNESEKDGRDGKHFARKTKFKKSKAAAAARRKRVDHNGEQILNDLLHSFFKKMGQSRPLFVYFRYFLITISIIQIEKSIDGVLGIHT